MKDIFNKKLFVQAFLQLRIVGIVCLVCSSIFTILVPIMYNLEHNDTTSYTYNRQTELMDIPSYFFPLLIVLFIITPLMCFLIFNFLTKRNGSDFYHAAPVKRRCVYISFLSAVIVWVALIITWYTFVLCTMFAITTDSISMNITNIIIYDINILISCILVAAVSGLACAVTGTLFSNFAVTVTILFAPRILISLLCANIYNTSPLVDSRCIPVIFNVSCNMPAHALFLPSGLLYGYSNETIFLGLNFSTFYTLILGVIYVVIGTFAYVKRPSESSGKAFCYKICNSVFRILVGFIISLFAVSMVYEGYTYSALYDYEVNYNITGIITVFAIAVSLMYICEAINSHSLKKSLIAFVTSPIVLLLDVITFLGLVFIGNAIANDRIDIKNTEYIVLNDIDEYYFSQYENDTYYEHYGSDIINSSLCSEVSLRYYENNIHDYKITDKKVIEYIANLYNTWCSEHDTKGLYHDESMEYYMAFSYDDDFGETKRILYLDKQQYSELIQLIDQYQLYGEILLTLPETDSLDVLYCNGLTSEQTHNLYNTMKNEIKNIAYNNWLTLLRKTYFSSSDNSNTLSSIFFEKYENGKYCKLSLPITSVTPESYKLYIKYYNANNKALIEKILNNPEDAFENTVREVSINAVKLSLTGNSYEHDNFSLFMPKCTTNAKDYLCTLLEDAIHIEDNEMYKTLLSDYSYSITSDYKYICYIKFEEMEKYYMNLQNMSYAGCYLIIDDPADLYQKFDIYKNNYTPKIEDPLIN